MNYFYKYILLFTAVFSLYIPDVQCLNLNVKSMSFNVNKDSLWLSYPLKRTSFRELSEKIPNTHKLSKCKVFEEFAKFNESTLPLPILLKIPLMNS